MLGPVQPMYPLQCVDSTEESIAKCDCAGVSEVLIGLKYRAPKKLCENIQPANIESADLFRSVPQVGIYCKTTDIKLVSYFE